MSIYITKLEGPIIQPHREGVHFCFLFDTQNTVPCCQKYSHTDCFFGEFCPLGGMWRSVLSIFLNNIKSGVNFNQLLNPNVIHSLAQVNGYQPTQDT